MSGAALDQFGSGLGISTASVRHGYHREIETGPIRPTCSEGVERCRDSGKGPVRHDSAWDSGEKLRCQPVAYRFADTFDHSIVLDVVGNVIGEDGGRFLLPEVWPTLRLEWEYTQERGR
jgi:hypothetical protein